MNAALLDGKRCSRTAALLGADAMAETKYLHAPEATSLMSLRRWIHVSLVPESADMFAAPECYQGNKSLSSALHCPLSCLS